MSSLIGALCTVVLALVAVLAGSGPDAAAGITTTHDGAAYTYDASLSSSTQDVAAPSPRGSPATLPAASWEDSVPLARFGDAANTAGGGRGLNNLGGIISQEGTNAAGGRVFTSTGTITQNDFAGIVNSGLMRGENVHILTGSHGTPAGQRRMAGHRPVHTEARNLTRNARSLPRR